MSWVKLPVLKEIFQKFEGTILRKTGLSQRFHMQMLSRTLLPDLQQRLEAVYLLTDLHVGGSP